MSSTTKKKSSTKSSGKPQKKSPSKKSSGPAQQQEAPGGGDEGDTLSAEMMQQTRSMLEALISKPKLTDKLLSKPPFRFLHDVVSNVSANTGFLEGYFEGRELEPKSMDKHEKVDYLNKLIEAVKEASGEDLQVKPSKIVAGHEPDKTNELLQALATAASQYKQQNTQQGEDHTATEEQKAAEDDWTQLEQHQQAEPESVPMPQPKDSALAEGGEAKEPEAEEPSGQPPRRPQSRMSRQNSDRSSRHTGERERHRSSKKKQRQTNVFFAPEKYGVDGSHELTRELLGKIITRPKLTDKLLSKPPIRFLHDIVMNVQQNTGFANGLLSEEQKDSQNVKQKEEKIKFLTQLVDVVGIHLRTLVPANPAKIVAGLEPEKTNMLLQLLAIAAQSGAADEAVTSVCSGEHQKESYSGIGEGPVAAGVVDTEDNDEPSAGKTAEDNETFETPLPRESVKEQAEPAYRQEGRSEQRKRDAAPKSESKQEAASEEEEVVQPSNSRSTSNRPQTARKRPPKSNKDSGSVSSGGPSSRQGSADLRRKDGEMPAGVMAEGTDDSDSDEDRESEFADLNNKKVSDDAMAAAGKGKHTRDILQTQSKYETKKKGNDASESKHDGEGGIRFGKIKAKKEGSGFSVQDIEKLREAIQKLCQSTNPLGKSLDYVRDDLDDMRMELNQWRSEYEEYFAKLQQERKETEEEVIPYKSQLQSEEQKCEEVRHKITGMKTTIAKNEARIRELLEMVVTKGGNHKGERHHQRQHQ
eukprot:gb/GECG01014997.1/.p1 GENE.gb/GECG01014997.1/~~gb/GECG01014997.1/.p1  ORF type:complete len:754 (+),score=167.00 gb/GECG01014997.1/:1-2262(+)